VGGVLPLLYIAWVALGEVGRRPVTLEPTSMLYTEVTEEAE